MSINVLGCVAGPPVAPAVAADEFFGARRRCSASSCGEGGSDPGEVLGGRAAPRPGRHGCTERTVGLRTKVRSAATGSAD